MGGYGEDGELVVGPSGREEGGRTEAYGWYIRAELRSFLLFGTGYGTGSFLSFPNPTSPFGEKK